MHIKLKFLFPTQARIWLCMLVAGLCCFPLTSYGQASEVDDVIGRHAQFEVDLPHQPGQSDYTLTAQRKNPVRIQKTRFLPTPDSIPGKASTIFEWFHWFLTARWRM